MRVPIGHLPRAALALAFAAGLLLPGGARAQRGPRLLTDTLPPGDPIQILLARAAELKLGAEQVTRLEGIQRRLHAANDSLVQRLVALRHEVHSGGAVHPRDMTPEQRSAFRSAAQRARPLMQSISRNNVAAMDEVGAVLTSAQKALVRGWLGEPRTPGTGPQYRGGRGPSGGRGPGAGRGPGGRGGS